MPDAVPQLALVALVGFILPIVPVFPVRLAMLIPVVSASVHPLLVVIAASLGSSLGTMPLYVLTREVNDLVVVQRWLAHGWVRRLLTYLNGKMFLCVLLFALLPLPDQLMSVVGGFEKYPAWKLSVGFFIGRLPYYCALAFLGARYAETIHGAARALWAVFGM